jgi:hypothetical protein
MRSFLAFGACAALTVLAVAACSDSTSSDAVAALLPDSTITADVASTSGDAIASSVETMVASEATTAMPAAALAAPASSVSFQRIKTCLNGSGVVVPACSPIDSVRKIIFHVTADGTRDGSNTVTGGNTVTWSGAIHRVADDTIARNFNSAVPPVEISRTHNAVSTAHDTTSFSDNTVSRTHDEAAHDTVKAVTWNLPRSNNPFPISGSIVRVDSIHAVATKNGQTVTRDAVRTVEVDFPADNQGNVVLKINGKTCNLNLVTHKVSNCH